VVHEARRGVLDWAGCALAASRHPTIRILLDTSPRPDPRPSPA
jgi:2-methylcitrate dehydratase PrpD